MNTLKTLEEGAGVYLIRCRANGASYAGSSLTVLARVKAHLSQLRAGRSGAALLQLDWDKFGQQEFEILVSHRPANELNYWEETLTLLSDSLEDFGGYNKMLGNRSWSLSARIKSTEQKLQRRHRFEPLRGHDAGRRLNPEYVRSYCQGSVPFGAHDPILVNDLDGDTKQRLLMEHLAAYICLAAASAVLCF